MTDKKLHMIDFFGDTVRFGVEGKWVLWTSFTELFDDGHKPTRKEMHAIIEEQDKSREAIKLVERSS